MLPNERENASGNAEKLGDHTLEPTRALCSPTSRVMNYTDFLSVYVVDYLSIFSFQKRRNQTMNTIAEIKIPNSRSDLAISSCSSCRQT